MEHGGNPMPLLLKAACHVTATMWVAASSCCGSCHDDMGIGALEGKGTYSSSQGHCLGGIAYHACSLPWDADPSIACLAKFQHGVHVGVDAPEVHDRQGSLLSKCKAQLVQHNIIGSCGRIQQGSLQDLLLGGAIGSSQGAGSPILLHCTPLNHSQQLLAMLTSEEEQAVSTDRQGPLNPKVPYSIADGTSSDVRVWSCTDKLWVQEVHQGEWLETQPAYQGRLTGFRFPRAPRGEGTSWNGPDSTGLLVAAKGSSLELRRGEGSAASTSTHVFWLDVAASSLAAEHARSKEPAPGINDLSATMWSHRVTKEEEQAVSTAIAGPFSPKSIEDTPTKTPQGPVLLLPDESCASAMVSSNRRCCGSMRAASAPPSPNMSASNLSTFNRKAPNLLGTLLVAALLMLRSASQRSNGISLTASVPGMLEMASWADLMTMAVMATRAGLFLAS
ncbi:MAG: hypothetical protein FRX49_03369 [Trebouxia sp. A1-2]|nr:MAG: hypothetical protein FRX49_03369 [Trebouxia sp. A1-2]